MYPSSVVLEIVVRVDVEKNNVHVTTFKKEVKTKSFANQMNRMWERKVQHYAIFEISSPNVHDHLWTTHIELVSKN